MAVEHGIGLVVVDNGDDVDRLEATVPAGRTQDVLVRVIPGVTADTHAYVLTGHEGSKFGLAPAAAAELIRRIERSPRLSMRGLHVHVGSQILDVEPFARVRRAARRARGVPRLRPRRRPRRPLHLRRRAARGRRLPRRARSAPPARTCPRRRRSSSSPAAAWSPSAAATLYRVVTVKRGAKTFVAVDGGMGDNLEVALFDQRFEAGDRRPARRAGGGETVTVVGRHCESGDVLVDGVALDAPRVGDLLAVPATGRVLLHDGQQLQRHPAHPRGLRGRRRGAPGRAPRDAGTTCSRATSSEEEG